MIQFRFAMNDIKRNVKIVLIVIGFLLITGYFFMLMTTTLLLNLDFVNEVQRIRDENITFFRIYYPSEGSGGITSETQRWLAQALDNNRAYSFVQSPELSRRLGADVIFAFGIFDEVFDIELEGTKTSSSPFKILFGNKVNGLGEGDLIELDSHINTSIKAEVIGRLPRGASYLTPHSSRVNKLNNSIVVLAEYETWSSVYWPDSQILANMCFVNTPTGYITSFVEGIVDSSSLRIIPASFYDYVLEKNIHQIEDTVLFLLFFLSIIFLIGVGIVANLLLLIDRNLREYAIHRLYGATLTDLYLRTVIYVSTLILPPFAIVYSRLNSLFPFMTSHVDIGFVCVVISIIGIVVIIPFKKLRNQNVALCLRRD